MNRLAKLADLGNLFNHFKNNKMTITGRFVKAFGGVIAANEAIIKLCGDIMDVADKSDKKKEIHDLAGRILTENKKIIEAFEEEPAPAETVN